MEVTSYLSSGAAVNSANDRNGGFASLADSGLANAMQHINQAIEEEEDLESLIERVGESLLEVMMTREPSAQGSIWLTEHPPEDSDGRIVPFLKCRHIFGENRWPDNRIRRFGAGSVDGLIGWVAHHRQAINRRVHDPDEDPLPDGKGVMDQYLPRVKPDHVGAELAVPMLFRDRLVGVLNLERPEGERFSRDSELIAEMVALHLAQGIHQRRVDQLFSWILGESDINRLAEMVVTEGAKILEAPFAGLFLWDVPTQTLRLAASTATIIDEDRVLTPEDVCFSVQGVGIVRWSFEQRMWLNVRDTESYLDRDKVESHELLMREIQSQIVDQRFGGSLNYEVEDWGEHTNNKQRFWRFTAAGKTLEVPQPIWKTDCHFRAGHARSLVTVPIVDHRPGPACHDGRPTDSSTSRPVLGVLLFARREPKVFSGGDLALLQALARHLSQTILLSQTARARDLERGLISEIVTMQPASWKKEFQHRLEQRLGEMHRVFGENVALLVRVRERDELSLVANYPTQDDLRRIWLAPDLVIPPIAEVGVGGSGRAAERKEPVHFSDEDSEICREIRRTVVDTTSGQYAFVQNVRSGTAVPLLVGEKVVGTLSAVSSLPARLIITEEDGRWTGQVMGVHQHHEHFLQSCAQWLGPALLPIQELVRRSRQLSTLSTAIRNLTKVLRDRDEPILSRLIAMIMATHHDGLALHQVFIARCERGHDIGSATIIRADRDFAWGCRGAVEQIEAHHGEREVQVDLDRVLEDSTPYCTALRESWRTFRVELPLPKAPCLIARAPTESDEPPGHDGVLTHYADRNEGLAKLLDSFCGIFGIMPDSDTGRRFQLAMVRLDDRSTPRPRSVMFATNIAFSRHSSGEASYCNPITLDTIGVLQDLGSLLALARGVARRKRHTDEMRQLARAFLRKSLSNPSMTDG